MACVNPDISYQTWNRLAQSRNMTLCVSGVFQKVVRLFVSATAMPMFKVEFVN